MIEQTTQNVIKPARPGINVLRDAESTLSKASAALQRRRMSEEQKSSMIATLKGERDDLQLKLTKAETDIAELRQELVDQAASSDAERKAERDQLNATLEGLKRDIRRKNREIEQLSENITAKDAVNDEKDEEISSLKGRLKQSEALLMEQKSSHEKSLEDRLESQANLFKRKEENLTASLEKAEQMVLDVRAEYREKMTESQKKLDEALIALEASESDLNHAQLEIDRLSQMVRDLTSALSGFMAEEEQEVANVQ